VAAAGVAAACAWRLLQTDVPQLEVVPLVVVVRGHHPRCCKQVDLMFCAVCGIMHHRVVTTWLVQAKKIGLPRWSPRAV
jgi:hypothetical protein